MESTQDRLYHLEEELLPNKAQMKKGLGNIKEIKNIRGRLAFSEAITDRFDKMTIEESDDWIACIKNKPQSFDSYVKSKPNRLYDNK